MDKNELYSPGFNIFGKSTLSVFQHLVNENFVKQDFEKTIDNKSEIKVDKDTFVEISPTGKTIERTRIVISFDNEKKVLLAADDEAYAIIVRMFPGYNDIKIAELLGLNTVNIANIRNKARSMNFFEACRIFLMLKQLPSVKEFNHILVEIGETALYFSTFYKHINVRNAVITSAFEFFAQKEDYIQKVDGPTRIKAINFLINKIIKENRLPDTRCYILSKKYTFTEEELQTKEICEINEAFATYSKDFIDQVLKAEPVKARELLLEAYMDKYGLSIKEAKKEVCDKFKEQTYFSDAVVNHLFNYNQDNIGSREVIINLGLALECNIKEITLLLIEGDHPLLYLSSMDDIEIIKKFKEVE